MPIPKLWVIITAAIVAVVAGIAGLNLVQPSGDLIQSAAFSHERITPNADQQDDVAIFRYTLSRKAQISLVFESQNGQRFVFRDNKPRTKGDYSVAFSGIVDGFKVEGEKGFTVPSEKAPNLPLLETRLIPDGVYTWTLTAVDDNGKEMTKKGTLEIVEADATLPLFLSFDIGPQEFTPNQDGIDDRVHINIYLSKTVDSLQVYLENEAGERTYLAERQGGRELNEEGNHEYDYDGGVDQGFRPPPDGIYQVYAVAQDAEGQRIKQTSQLTIRSSGLPQVEIIPQSSGGTVCFDTAPYEDMYYTDSKTTGQAIPQPTTVCSELTTLTLPVGNMLIFHLTVRNYGDTPIRTAGPFPGAVYGFDQRASTLGAYEESGAWRVGIDCETAMSDYPWRWALAPQDQLTAVYDPFLESTLYYLEPDQQAEVWGAIRLTEIVDARNPQNCWAGLIHEDVGIPASQNNVGQREVELVPSE